MDDYTHNQTHVNTLLDRLKLLLGDGDYTANYSEAESGELSECLVTDPKGGVTRWRWCTDEQWVLMSEVEVEDVA